MVLFDLGAAGEGEDAASPLQLSGDAVDFHKAVLDAIPLPVFVVDEDVRIGGCNAAALTLLGVAPPVVFRKRGGEVLHCIHSTETPGGCGTTPSCRECSIRNSVKKAIAGETVTRVAQRMQLVDGTRQVAEVHVLVTTAPVQLEGRKLALLILENISELIALRNIVPICAGCKKIRTDAQFWQSVEVYFASKLDIDFSHGICPDCSHRLYPEFSVPEPT